MDASLQLRTGQARPLRLNSVRLFLANDCRFLFPKRRLPASIKLDQRRVVQNGRKYGRGDDSCMEILPRDVRRVTWCRCEFSESGTKAAASMAGIIFRSMLTHSKRLRPICPHRPSKCSPGCQHNRQPDSQRRRRLVSESTSLGGSAVAIRRLVGPKRSRTDG
jgi:hypothetical protein